MSASLPSVDGRMVHYIPQEHPSLVSNERTDIGSSRDQSAAYQPVVPSPFKYTRYTPVGYASDHEDEHGTRGPSYSHEGTREPSQGVKRGQSMSPGDEAEGSGGPSRKSKKFSRTRQGCLTCRSRKVKCGEEKPVCRKCQIGGRECAWQDDSGSPTTRIIYRYSPVPIRPAPQRERTHDRPSTSTPPNELSVSDPFTSGSMAGIDIPQSLVLPRASVLDALPPARFINPPPAIEAAAVTKGQYVPFPRGYHPVALPIKQIDALDVVREMVPSNMRLSLISNPEFLRPYFPAADERMIIHHYFHNTINIIMAFHPELKPWNPWLSVHAAMAFNNVPGQSGASDALRLAMLTVGSVHLHYLSNPLDQIKALKMVRTARKTIMTLLRPVMRHKDVIGTAPDDDCDVALAALLSCTIASSLVGDDAWQDILTAGVNLIDQNGGASDLLRFASRKHMTPYRFCLEQMAVRDVFGCMTTGKPPTILKSAFMPWFFEAETWSKDAGEWESVERMFGISRGVVDLIARACTIGAKVRNTGITVLEHDPEARTDTDRAYDRSSDAFHLRLPSKFTGTRSMMTGHIPRLYTATRHSEEDPTRDFGDPRREALEESANQLMAEIRVWQETANFVCHSPRTQYGNHAHRHAMRIYLLRNVFGASKNDPRVQTSANAILELAKELLSAFGKIVWFTWPVLIAGVHMPQGDPGRKSAMELMGEFSPHACFDNQKAGRVLQEFWKTYDANPDLDPSWWSMMDAIGMKAFFD